MKDGIDPQLNGSMCYVIVTSRSLLWTLLSLVALMAVLSGLITPKWLIGPQIKDTSNYFLLFNPYVVSMRSKSGIYSTKFLTLLGILMTRAYFDETPSPSR